MTPIKLKYVKNKRALNSKTIGAFVDSTKAWIMYTGPASGNNSVMHVVENYIGDNFKSTVHINDRTDDSQKFLAFLLARQDTKLDISELSVVLYFEKQGKDSRLVFEMTPDKLEEYIMIDGSAGLLSKDGAYQYFDLTSDVGKSLTAATDTYLNAIVSSRPVKPVVEPEPYVMRPLTPEESAVTPEYAAASIGERHDINLQSANYWRNIYGAVTLSVLTLSLLALNLFA